MDVEFELLDLPLSVAVAKKMHDEIFDQKNDSFFIGWSWISSWINIFNKENVKQDGCHNAETRNKLKLLIINKNKKPLAALFCGVEERNFCFFKSRKAFLGATGIKSVDSICIERNNILFSKSDDSWRVDINEILSFLDVRSLTIPGASDSSLVEITEKIDIDFKKSILREIPTYFVNLPEIKDFPEGSFSILSSNKRSQINRTLKFYGGRKVICIKTPSGVDNAIEMFDELFDLHSKQWLKKKKPSLFSNSTAKDFHHHLIRDAWGNGGIGLYQIRNNECILGYLYGFISNDSFLFYQSAFMYESDNKIKSGFLCHLLLIEYLSEKGFKYYDFLAGDTQYKKSLSTDKYLMIWVEIYKHYWMYYSVKKIRFLKKKAHSLLKPIFSFLSIRGY